MFSILEKSPSVNITQNTFASASWAVDNTGQEKYINKPVFNYACLFSGRDVFGNRVGIGQPSANSNPFSPTHMLHVDATNLNGINLGRVLRLVGLTELDTTTILTVNLKPVDYFGGVHFKTLSSLSNNNICHTANFISKTDPNNTNNQICSQIYDNGGIGNFTLRTFEIGFANAANRSYTYNQNTQTQGPNLPPTGNNRVVRLDVNGVICCLAVLVTSYKRMKKDFNKIEQPLEKIKKLNDYTYYWKDGLNNETTFDNTKQIGFITQEVEKIIPEAVITDEFGNYSMNYNMILPVLNEAIKNNKN